MIHLRQTMLVLTLKVLEIFVNVYQFFNINSLKEKVIDLREVLS